MPRTAPTAFRPPAASTEGLAVGDLGRVLRRSRAWIALPTLAAAAASVAFVQVVPPRYTGETKLLLENRETAYTRSAGERGDVLPQIDEQAVASQVQVAMSRDIAREAIRRLKLVGNPEFDPSVEGAGPLRSAMMLLGLGKGGLDRPAEDRVLEAYFDRLLVYPAGKSRILAVEFRSRDAELAAKAANTVAELYIASLDAAKVDTARHATSWLGGNIETLRRRVAEAEAKVEAYRARSGLIGSGNALNQPLTGQQLGEMSSQLSQARAVQAELAGRVKAIKDMIKDGRAFEIPDVANNELIRRTVESRIALRSQLALESRTLLPAHPRIKELTAQVAELDGQIKSAAERIVRTLENDSKIAGSRVESLQAAVTGQSDVVAKGNTSEIQLRALEREAKAQREQLESYLSRFREAAARDGESVVPADARIVSRAITPDLPSFPKKLPIVGFSTLLAFLLAMGAVIGRHLLAEPAPTAARKRGEEDEADVVTGRPAARIEPAPFAFPEAGPPPVREEEMPRIASALRGTIAPEAAAPVEEAMPAAAPPQPMPAHPEPAATPEPDAPFDLDALIGRLADGPRRGVGRTVLVVETQDRAAGNGGLGETLARALAERGAALHVDLAGEPSHLDRPGLTDLVAGDVDFVHVIHPVGRSRLHRVERGFVETAVLLEEPQALAICLEALPEAYPWVVCAMDAGAEDGEALLEAVAAHMDGVVLVSDAKADDPRLVTLYGLAEKAGAGQVLVASDTVATAAETAPPQRSAA